METILKQTYTYATKWLHSTLWTYNQISITPLSLVRFIIFILLAIWLAKFALNLITAAGEKRLSSQRSLLYRLGRLVYYSIIGLGVLFALSTIGFDFSTLALLAGALGIGLGFGMQAIFNNFFSGIILLFENQLQIGDFVELEGGVKGEIQDINFRTTQLKTAEGALIFVPNSALINNRLSLIWTPATPYRCLCLPFSLAPNSNPDIPIKNLLEKARQKEQTVLPPLRPDPAVYLLNASEDKLDYQLCVWVKEKNPAEHAALMSDYRHLLEGSLKKERFSKG
ncbi:mechanosensitive ion channel family protein [Candidatus Protochlamydia phocaeensis]|uniref:mechanosensitive ion channel family protein n=1 Tax=Candidatus Protochlamydia phocaeensis TaxID=1414722 RepID=UPI000838E7BB|nr:mechanosensitive ion channel domain-containing protein [Candidatus Protochlamydia phocaeensis]